MKKTKTQKNFKKYMASKGLNKHVKKTPMVYYYKRTYKERLDEYMKKWFVYIFLARWIGVIVAVLILVMVLTIVVNR